MKRELVLDVAERCWWTFLQAFLGTFTLTDVSTVRAAAVAGLASILSAVKSLAASKVAGTLSPASTVKA